MSSDVEMVLKIEGVGRGGCGRRVCDYRRRGLGADPEGRSVAAVLKMVAARWASVSVWTAAAGRWLPLEEARAGMAEDLLSAPAYHWEKRGLLVVNEIAVRVSGEHVGLATAAAVGSE